MKVQKAPLLQETTMYHASEHNSRYTTLHLQDCKVNEAVFIQYTLSVKIDNSNHLIISIFDIPQGVT